MFINNFYNGLIKDLKNVRDYEMELTGIKSTDEVMIDFTKVLNIKKGDLVIIQGDVFKCTPAANHLRDI